MALILYRNSGGPTNTDATGSPFDSNQNACTQCHSTYNLNSGTGSVSLNTPTSYYPGETYTITVSVSQTVPPPAKYGFQSVPLRDNNSPGGTITTGTGQGSWTSSGRNYVQHNSTANTSGNWSFTWNAPSFSDTIVFYTAGLAANGANGNANDYAYTTTNTILPLERITFTSDSTDASCFGTCDGSASVSVTGGGVPPYSYLWSNGDTTSTSNGLCSGTYTVTISDSEGHEEVDTMVVSQPDQISLQFTTFPSSCAFGDGQVSVNASGGAGSYTYLWNDSSGTTDNTILQAGAGWFTVTVTDSSGCSVVDSAEIQEGTSGLNAIDQSTPEHCGQGDGVAAIAMFAGNAPYQYAWSTGANTASVDSLTAGTYTVTVVDDHGCTETFNAVVGSVDLVINIDSSFTSPTTCFNGADGSATIQLASGEGPFNYYWSHDSTANSATQNGLMGGQYTITVEDDAGCLDSITLLVESPDSMYTVVEVDSANEGFCDGSVHIAMNGGTAPYTFQWPHNNTLNDSSATDLCAGTYQVTITDDAGCLFITTGIVPSKLGVDAHLVTGIKLYPNPAQNALWVELPLDQVSAHYVITDFRGALVTKGVVNRSQSIDVRELESGNYLIMLEFTDGVRTSLRWQKQ